MVILRRRKFQAVFVDRTVYPSFSRSIEYVHYKVRKKYIYRGVKQYIAFMPVVK